MNLVTIKTSCFLLCFFPAIMLQAQPLDVKLQSAYTKLMADPQFAHSIAGLYVIESNSGKVIFEKNAQTGMAPASCQKVITSSTAFELMGSDFKYQTYVGTNSTKLKPVLDADLVIKGTGDPGFGSWRWKSTAMENTLERISKILTKHGVSGIKGSVVTDNSYLNYQPVPDGWIWQDIGNYYGAGAWSLNWHENQYDLHLRSEKTPGKPTTLLRTEPFDLAKDINNMIISGEPGSGDNGYLYSAPYSSHIFATGSIPPGENDFTISGSLPDPSAEFRTSLTAYFQSHNIAIGSNDGDIQAGSKFILIDSISSPGFDSLNYWFLKKSINLYGEAFVKTMSKLKGGNGSTGDGVAVIKNFWKQQGVDPAELNMMDGSGLSPANRITCHALVTVLEYARRQQWFKTFYNDLPEMNGLKMKDGYINGVRSYTGFVQSKSGVQYSFAFMVNNFDGNPSTVRTKMWAVLDLLK